MGLFSKRSNHGFNDRSSVGSFIMAPFRAIFGLLLGFLVGTDNELGQQLPVGKRIWRGCVRFVYFPFWLVFQTLKFIVLSWTTTRDGTSAIWATVPMMGILAVIAVVTASALLEDRRILGLHAGKAKSYFESEDFDEALLYSRRVQNISNADALKYQHAMILGASKMEKNSLAVLKEMASPDEAGYLPAHIFLAQTLDTQGDDETALRANQKIACKHYEIVIDKSTDTRDPSYQFAVKRLPMVMFMLGDVDLAMAHFANNSAATPEVVPDLARYLIENGNRDKADFHIERGLKTIERRLNFNSDDRLAWKLLRDILMVNQDYDAAIQGLDSGLRMKNLPNTKWAILVLQSEVFIEKARLIESVDSPELFRTKLKPVVNAISRSPGHGVSIDEFVRLVMYPSNQNVHDWILKEARDSVNPTMFHVITGIRDGIYGKPATANRHFRLAYNNDSRIPAMVNNIANRISQYDGLHEDALKLIDIAIQAWQGSARLLQTKSNILVRMGQPVEALANLEYANEAMPSDPFSKLSLADCYEALGRTEEAEHLRALAAEDREAQVREQAEQYEKARTGGKKS